MVKVGVPRVHEAQIQMHHSVVICTVLSCLMFQNFVLKFEGLIVDYIFPNIHITTAKLTKFQSLMVMPKKINFLGMLFDK